MTIKPSIYEPMINKVIFKCNSCACVLEHTNYSIETDDYNFDCLCLACSRGLYYRLKIGYIYTIDDVTTFWDNNSFTKLLEKHKKSKKERWFSKWLKLFV